MKKLGLILQLVTAIGTGNLAAQGTIAIQHWGAADPTTEGFSLLRFGNPSLAAATNDQGRAAWLIGVQSVDIAQYSYSLTPEQTTALANGWVLSATLRVLPPFGPPTSARSILFYPVTGRIGFSVGSTADGDPIIGIGLTNYVFFGLGPGYHTYQLRWDPEAQVAALWVDGVERISGLRASPGQVTSPTLFWGAGQHPGGTHNTAWHEVSLTILPEPSTFALVSAGLLFWSLRRRADQRFSSTPAS